MKPLSRLTAAWPLLAALVLALLLYWPGLHGPFVYDDAFNLAPVLEWHRDLMPWQDVVLGNPSGPLGRPVSMLSFLASGMLLGVEPFDFKLGNLLLHLTTGVLLWQVARRVLRLDVRLAPRANLLAALAAALWLLHPLHASTVLYAIQRMAQLAALFSLATLLAYLHARRLLEDGERRRGWTMLAVVAPGLWLLGLLSKENAAIAPLLCLLVEWLYPTRAAQAKAPLRGFLLATAVVPVFCGLGLLLVAPDRLLSGYAGRDFTAFERLLTQGRVLCDYLGQVFVPQVSRMSVYTDGCEASRGWLDPPATLIAWLVLATLTLAACAVRRRAPIATFGWLFFLVAHGVESTILPLDLAYEHRNYLPMAGLLVGVVGGVWQACTASRHPRVAGRVALMLWAVAALALAAGLLDRAQAWRSREHLLAEALHHHPRSLRAQLAQVDADAAAGRFGPALGRLRALEAGGSARARLIARMETLGMRCRAGEAVGAGDVASAFADPPPRLGTDEVQSASLLLQHTRPGECGAFDDAALGAALTRLANHTGAHGGATGVDTQLRFAAALAFARSQHPRDAARQAQLAWDNGAGMEVGFVLVWARVQLGETARARATLAQMERRQPRFSRAAEREVYKARVLLRGHRT